MKNNAKILIVDDEKDILEFLSYSLEKEGYTVETAKNGEKAIKKASIFHPDLIVLDIMMPDLNGIEVCTNLRENSDFDQTLIVFLTARNESFTQISALEAGGDDFISKPIKPKVFISKIKSILRRHPGLNGTNHDDNERFGDLEIDQDRMKVRIKGSTVSLAKKEFRLLVLLSSKPGKVFKRAEILNKVWGEEVIVGDRTIDVHIRKLRKKIGKDYIQTFKGVGYKFEY